MKEGSGQKPKTSEDIPSSFPSSRCLCSGKVNDVVLNDSLYLYNLIRVTEALKS